MIKAKIKSWLRRITKATVKSDLLWTNTTGGSFTARTIPLSLSGYDYVQVFFNDNTQSDTIVPAPLLVPLGKKRDAVVFHSLASAQANANVGTRSVTATESGVAFGDYAYKTYPSGSTRTVANQFCVPYKIYGVKLGGVLRNLSIFKAFRHFMLLQKGGGVDGQNGIEGTAKSDSRKNQGSSENSAVFEPADNLEHYGKSVSDVAEERSTGWIQTDSVSLCMLRNGRNYYIPVRSLHRRKHYLTRTALARNSRISNSKHNERNGSLHKERVSIIDPLISGRRWAA